MSKGEPTLADQTAYILDETVRAFDTYVVFPSDEHRDSATLWAAHAHVFEAFETTPRLSMRSLEPGSGKTLVLDIIEQLVPKAMNSVGVTPGVLWRLFENKKPTLILDEADTIFGRNGSGSAHQQLRGVINAGHRKGASVPRCVGSSEVKEFNVYGPIALGGLGRLPDTVATRSVEIVMRKRKAGDPPVKPFRLKYAQDALHALRRMYEQWSEVAMPILAKAVPELPVRDRMADVWEPLIAVADLAGERWGERARAACVALTAEQSKKTVSPGVQLLSDVRDVFAEREHMFTYEVVAALHGLPEWSPDTVDGRRMARMLAPYDVAPVNLRRGSKVAKGYRADQFYDIWERLLPPIKREIEV